MLTTSMWLSTAHAAQDQVGDLALSRGVQDLQRVQVHVRRHADDQVVVPLAARMPATCVPWPLSSIGSLSWLTKS